MESRLDKIRDIKSTVQDIRLEKNENVEDKEKWSTMVNNNGLEKIMECYDSPIEQLQSRFKSWKKQDKNEIKEKKYEDEHRKMKFRYEKKKENRRNEATSLKQKIEKDKWSRFK